MKDWKNLEARVEPVRNPYYQIEQKGNNVVNTIKKKLYEYYLCDNCGEKIKIEKNVDKRTGGILQIPISQHKSLKLAVCNRCLKEVLKDINETYKTNF